MNLKQLEAFLWVVELQSFTRAARHLFMSQPAVSFQIKALEDSLGVPLFKRGDKKIILTDAGQLLYSEAKHMLRHYYRIKSSLEELKGLKTGYLTIGASTIPGEYLLPFFIGSFWKKYPGIRVTLRVADSKEVVRMVRDRDVDLGITGAMIRGEGLDYKPWLDDQLVFIVHPDHRWAQRDAVKIEELQEEPVILREPGSGTRQVLEEKLEQAGLSLSQLQVSMELGSTRAIIAGVEAGLGVGVVSRLAIRESLALKKIKVVNVTGVELNRKLYLLRHTRETESFAASAFVEHITETENVDLPFCNA